MSLQTIAHNYAQAYFEAAEDAGILELIQDDASLLYDSLKSAGQLIYQLSSPGFSQEDRVKIMDRALGDTFTSLTRNFISLVIRHRRQNLLLPILDELLKLFDQKKRVIKAKLTSAYPLDTAQRQKLQTKLEQKTGFTLEVDYTTDPKLLAGFILVYNDTMFDCSTESALNKFSNTLKSLRY